jgi:putative heme-binding domain-containing protein
MMAAVCNKTNTRDGCRMRAFSLLLAAGFLAAGRLHAQDATGDVARGKAIVEGKGGCLSCHRIKDAGSTYGPDLSEIGGRQPAQIQTSIVDPDAEIAAAQRTFRVVTKAGETVTGRLVNLDTFTVQIFVPQERYRSFQKSDLKEWAFVEKSPMPSFKDRLTAPELADVVAYLSSMKPPPGAGRGGRGGAGGGAPPPGAPTAGAPPAGAGPGRGPGKQ